LNDEGIFFELFNIVQFIFVFPIRSDAPRGGGRSPDLASGLSATFLHGRLQPIRRRIRLWRKRRGRKFILAFNAIASIKISFVPCLIFMINILFRKSSCFA